MPELPEVETVARGLAATLEGHAIVEVQQNRANLRIPFPPNLKKRLEGRCPSPCVRGLNRWVASHYRAHNKRKHRWLRGDWQIAGWLLPRCKRR